jgi:hypothetical protein
MFSQRNGQVFAFCVESKTPDRAQEVRFHPQPINVLCVIAGTHDGGDLMQKTLAVLATVGALGVTAVAAPAPAEARGIGPGLAFGLAAGALAAGAYGAYGPYGYGYGPGYGYYGPRYYAPAYYGGPYAYYGRPYYRHRYYRSW